ncbi:MAG: hypothetical protein IJU76_09505 [Desulfovibrionaceae bacterium]|nr:hypothetical protein [Desulfovibrionaceae bacterium]
MEFISDENTSREISRGMRMVGNQPLSLEEIEFVRKEIRRIEADESEFVFNDPMHPKTCYAPTEDKVFVGRNIFPDLEYGSPTHETR